MHQCKPVVLTPCVMFTGLASFPATKPEALRGGCRRWVMASARGRGKRTWTQNRPRRHYSTCNEHNAPLTANLHHVKLPFMVTFTAQRLQADETRAHKGNMGDGAV